MASTTPMLSVGFFFFFFVVQVLSKAHEAVRLTDDFWHHQLAPFVGKIGSKPYYRFPDEKLHGTYSHDSDHQ